MASALTVGDKLHADYYGEFYPATVVAISDSKKRAKAPVKVNYVGFGEESDAWLSLDKLKSKKAGLKGVAANPKAKVKVKAKAKKEKKEKKDEKPAEPKPITILAGHAMDKAKTEVYNPEWVPGGDEGGVDTNTLPWLPLKHVPGVSFKPLRVSKETGAFTILLKMPAGTVMPTHVILGPQDTFILSGELTYPSGALKGSLGPGIWGYTPALAKLEGTKATKDTEYLATFYAPVAFLGGDGSVKSLLTGVDVRSAAEKAGIRLLPSTLLEALEEKPAMELKAPAEANNLSEEQSKQLCGRAADIATELTNPHYVDTNTLPWIGAPDDLIKIKVMRISAETGTVSLIVKQNGPAPPHYHLGPADFFITQGKIGYRAGPKEGYGPGTYMYEPAGARHEATQPVETDLIYTANVYGPIQFDSGVGTKVEMVFSWMSYLEAAKAFNSPLMASTFENDSSLLAPSI